MKAIVLDVGLGKANVIDVTEVRTLEDTQDNEEVEMELDEQTAIKLVGSIFNAYPKIARIFRR